MTKLKAIDIIRRLKSTSITIDDLSDEKRALMEVSILKLTNVAKFRKFLSELNAIHDKISHATEDLSESELNKIMCFIFENIDLIESVSNIDFD